MPRHARPTAVLQAQGTYHPSRHGERLDAPVTPDDELAAAEPPAFLSDRQRELWQGLLADAPGYVLARIDWPVFASYVEVLDRYMTAVEKQRQLDANLSTPLLVKGKHGAIISPYVKIANGCILIMTRLAHELGFSPSGRAGLKARPVDPDDNDLAQDWGALRVVQGGRPG